MVTGLIVVLCAGAAGIGQAVLLRRAALLGPRPTGALMRVGLVAAVLSAAALAGWLAAGVVGWGTGFAGSAIAMACRAR